jgi:hypothetical protein
MPTLVSLLFFTVSQQIQKVYLSATITELLFWGRLYKTLNYVLTPFRS